MFNLVRLDKMQAYQPFPQKMHNKFTDIRQKGLWREKNETRGCLQYEDLQSVVMLRH